MLFCGISLEFIFSYKVWQASCRILLTWVLATLPIKNLSLWPTTSLSKSHEPEWAAIKHSRLESAYVGACNFTNKCAHQKCTVLLNQFRHDLAATLSENTYIVCRKSHITLSLLATPMTTLQYTAQSMYSLELTYRWNNGLIWTFNNLTCLYYFFILFSDWWDVKLR